MNSKLSLLCITLSIGMAALFSGTDPSYSCGPSADYEKYRISYVDPDLLSDSIYQSLYKTVLQEHESQDYFEMPCREFYGTRWEQIRDAENIHDWEKYFGGTVSERSIHDLIYKTTSAMIAPLSHSMQIGLPPRSDDSNYIVFDSQGNSDTLEIGDALKEIFQHRDLSFLTYLPYAQECSNYAVAPDPWSEKEQVRDTATMSALIDQGISLHNECRSDFLRLRYAYQVVRMSRYLGEYQRAMELYDKLVEPNLTKSPIRFWALGQKAGAARLAGNMTLSNYYFSQIFDSCEGQREICVRDFKLRNDADWNDVYGLAQNDHERATLWMLRGFKEEGLSFDYMREMYKLEPNSPRMALTLLRELHRIESYLYANRDARSWKVREDGGRTDENYDEERGEYLPVINNVDPDWFGPSSYQRHIARGYSWDTLVSTRYDEEANEEHIIQTISGREYVSAFRRFVMDLAREERVMEPALWYMVAGYIDLMDQDFKVADECLEEAKRLTAGNEDLRQQIVLLDFMRRVKSRGEIDRELEDQIYPTLQWFQKMQQKNHHTKFDRVMTAIGQQYLVQDDIPRAILAFARSEDWRTIDLIFDLYADHNDLEELKALLATKGRTDYERMLIESIRISENGLIDLQGTKYLREGEFQRAYDLLKQLPDSYWPDDPWEDYYGENLKDENEEPEDYETSMYRFHPVTLGAYPEWFYSGTDTTFISGHNLIPGAYYNSIPDKEAAELHAEKFNKKTFTLKLLQLQEEAERHPKQADSTYYKLANLLFNNWRWSRGDITGIWDGTLSKYDKSAADYPFNIAGVAKLMEQRDKKLREEFGTRNLARSYYERVMKLTKDRELQARCAYMLDICRKRPQTNIVHHPEAKEQDRTGYNMLITKYRDTRFAKWILSQCSIYRYFEKQRLGKG